MIIDLDFENDFENSSKIDVKKCKESINIISKKASQLELEDDLDSSDCSDSENIGESKE